MPELLVQLHGELTPIAWPVTMLLGIGAGYGLLRLSFDLIVVVLRLADALERRR